MSGRDGTGPFGIGVMSGRGLGFCSGKNMLRRGAGLGIGLLLAKRSLRSQFVRRGAVWGLGICPGLGLGFKRGYASPANDEYGLKSKKELLEDQKAQLENLLAIVNRQIESLS